MAIVTQTMFIVVMSGSPIIIMYTIMCWFRRWCESAGSPDNGNHYHVTAVPAYMVLYCGINLLLFSSEPARHLGSSWTCSQTYNPNDVPLVLVAPPKHSLYTLWKHLF